MDGSFVNGLAIGRQDGIQLDPSAMPYKHKADRRGVVAWITRQLILSGGFQSQVFSLLIRISTMPHKFNADRRDKIAKQKYQVTKAGI
ncbi:hypothetical protein SF83666_a40360 (plasmid) [Sinorhizobium fredii CCBAU 83666]|nr:hypothetical protein SF83666_a40360 [Sinorhizobium fredii CCBAU 83666]